MLPLPDHFCVVGSDEPLSRDDRVLNPLAAPAVLAWIEAGGGDQPVPEEHFLMALTGESREDGEIHPILLLCPSLIDAARVVREHEERKNLYAMGGARLEDIRWFSMLPPRMTFVRPAKKPRDAA